MRTVAYNTVLQRACELTGRVYPPSTEEAVMFGSYISIALRQVWEAFDWPENRAYSKERFAPVYNSATSYSPGSFVYFPTESAYYQRVGDAGSGVDPTTGGPGGVLNGSTWAEAFNLWNEATNFDSVGTYTVGDIVYYPPLETYYQCIQDTSGSNNPTVTSYWRSLIPFYRNISLTHTSENTVRSNEVGEILSITAHDPRVETGYNFSEVNALSSSDGITILDEALPHVWLLYRLSPPITASGTIPYRFADYCVHAAASRMFTVDGKLELGQELTVVAQSIVTDEVNKVTRETKNTEQIIVRNR